MIGDVCISQRREARAGERREVGLAQAGGVFAFSTRTLPGPVVARGRDEQQSHTIALFRGDAGVGDRDAAAFMDRHQPHLEPHPLAVGRVIPHDTLAGVTGVDVRRTAAGQPKDTLAGPRRVMQLAAECGLERDLPRFVAREPYDDGLRRVRREDFARIPDSLLFKLHSGHGLRKVNLAPVVRDLATVRELDRQVAERLVTLVVLAVHVTLDQLLRLLVLARTQQLTDLRQRLQSL